MNIETCLYVIQLARCNQDCVMIEVIVTVIIMLLFLAFILYCFFALKGCLNKLHSNADNKPTNHMFKGVENIGKRSHS